MHVHMHKAGCIVTTVNHTLTQEILHAFNFVVIHLCPIYCNTTFHTLGKCMLCTVCLMWHKVTQVTQVQKLHNGSPSVLTQGVFPSNEKSDFKANFAEWLNQSYVMRHHFCSPLWLTSAVYGNYTNHKMFVETHRQPDDSCQYFFSVEPHHINTMSCDVRVQSQNPE